ncbi:hypothetical protein VOLCADRAFT_118051 [Volvox carteri f. nagariensis]|uniref:tRNA (uracil(54)-C(5))-methyltransferase n=1 Tax=Volvox carteri f. nagariensis TaxID=3068 RepID=D8U0F0_VOLCA|nr:uncharacterized protein VOLCADRAFT_118051 [Volvox carteri f. nagariensis]EFJ46848.1 hypothetical protein VOLCADRAFT_118051 [Volvox carteri f. nagariensis]|eukprot:XP_002952057.1 hypothetical protein VOLCADRAFT_118051 [Volvox carteri f. nagariensis]
MAAIEAPVVEGDTEPSPSPSFVAPLTVTNIDESQYGSQLQAKVFKLKELFREFDPPDLEVFESPPRRAPPQPPPLKTALKAPLPQPALRHLQQWQRRHVEVNELMEAVRQECIQCPELRNRLFQVNFHTTLAGDAMVTLLYHRKLGAEWTAAAERLRDVLAATPTAAAAGRRPHVIGRSRKQKVDLDASFVLERLRVGGREYVQKQVEGAFSQPNGTVCQHMLGWALDVTRPPPPRRVRARREGGEGGGGGVSSSSGNGVAAKEVEEAAAVVATAEAVETPGEGGGDGGEEEDVDGPQDDLLELYCGNGNFTVPLAQNFRRVVATEVAKSSVEAARFNLEANGVSNVFLARMASEEFAETMRSRGSRRRLEGLGPWEELRLRTILVDPPRAGLDGFTVELLKEFDRIVYISCNPETLHANLRAIATTHKIARFAAFDQFPYTHHLECGVYLTRR